MKKKLWALTTNKSIHKKISEHVPWPLRFWNMKSSVQGSIRKAPNALSWVYSLLAMRHVGLQPDLVIRTWFLICKKDK